MENTEFPTFDELPQNEVILQMEDIESSEVETAAETVEDEVVSQEETAEVITEDPLARATYEALVEKGVLSEDEAFDGTFEYVDSKLDELPNQLLKKAIDVLPTHSQSVLKYIAAAGDNLTEDELKSFMMEYLGEMVQPDLTTLDSARAFLEDHLKSQGLRPAAIQAQLDDLEDSNELISEAEKLQASKPKKTEQLIQQKAEEQQQTIEAQKQFYTSIKTELSQTQWAKSQQDKVLQTIPKTNQILSDVIKSPKAYIQMIDFLSKFDGKEFNLADFEKRGESRATSSLKAKIEKSGFSSATTKTSGSSDEPTKDSFKNYDLIV